MSYLLVVSEDASMWFKRSKRRALIEQEIQAIRAETDKAVENAEDKTEKVNKLLEDGGVADVFFVAMGGKKGKYGRR